MQRRSGRIAFVLAGIAFSQAAGQEPINAAESATQPSPGHAIFKEQFRFSSLRLEEGERERRGTIQDSMLLTTLNIGVRPDLAVSLRIPAVFRSRDLAGVRRRDREPGERRQVRDMAGEQHDEGIGDFTALAKWRVFRADTGPVDSARLSVLGGLNVRSGDSPFTSDGYNPLLGLAFTQVAGRHGANASVQWMFTTDGNSEPIYAGESDADLLRYDLAYLFRLAPQEYTATTKGAWYAVCELNGLYETNGDHELFLSPGLMYEAKTWTLELSIQLPAWQRVEHRAEAEYVLVAGVRFSL